MSKRYLEDFAVGQTFGSGRLRVDKEQIKTFAAEFDAQPFHLDEEAAHDTIFRDRPRAAGTPQRSPCGSSWRESSSPPAALSAPASTSSAGRGPCDPETSCA